MGVAILVELVQALALPGQPSGTLTDAMVVAILVLPVDRLLPLRDPAAGEAPLGWLLIGAGLAFNWIGEAYFFFAQRTLTDFPVAR